MKYQILNLAGVYLLFSLIFGFSKILTNIIAGEALLNEISLTDIVLIPIKPLTIYWYLYTLVILYIVYCVLHKQEMNKWVLVAVLFIISASARYTNVRYFTVSKLMQHLLFFYMGLSYKKYGKRILNDGKKVAVIFAISFLALLISDFSVPHIFGADTLISIGMSVGVWSAFEKVSFLNNVFFRFIGKNSLGIYVMHNIILAVIRYILNIIEIYQTWICILLSLILTIIVCILIIATLKKIKLYDLFFKPATYICHIREEHMAKN